MFVKVRLIHYICLFLKMVIIQIECKYVCHFITHTDNKY